MLQIKGGVSVPLGRWWCCANLAGQRGQWEQGAFRAIQAGRFASGLHSWEEVHASCHMWLLGIFYITPIDMQHLRPETPRPGSLAIDRASERGLVRVDPLAVVNILRI
jgi:hypothetical protein